MPVDGHLLHTEPEPAGDGNGLDVERPPIFPTVGQDRPPQLCARDLGAALGVRHSRRQAELQEPVVGLPQGLPPSTLGFEQAGGGDVARADGEDGSHKGGNQDPP